MPDMKRIENVKAKGMLKIGVLKLKRETLRELDAGELKQAQGGFVGTGSCQGTVDCPKSYLCGQSKGRC